MAKPLILWEYVNCLYICVGIIVNMSLMFSQKTQQIHRSFLDNHGRGPASVRLNGQRMLHALTTRLRSCSYHLPTQQPLHQQCSRIQRASLWKAPCLPRIHPCSLEPRQYILHTHKRQNPLRRYGFQNPCYELKRLKRKFGFHTRH